MNTYEIPTKLSKLYEVTTENSVQPTWLGLLIRADGT